MGRAARNLRAKVPPTSQNRDAHRVVQRRSFLLGSGLWSKGEDHEGALTLDMFRLSSLKC